MNKHIDDKELIDKLYPIGSFFFTYLHLEEHDPNKFFKNTTWVYAGHDLIKKFWKRVR